MVTQEFIDQASRIVGRRNCFTDAVSIELYSYDSSPFIHRPDLAALPGSLEELSALMRLAAGHNVNVVPRGAGTSLSGGAVAKEGGLMLPLTRLNKIIKLDLLEETVVVEGGVVNLELQNYLAPHGYMFPPDPASQRSATIGGNIAENAGGPRGVKYGITKHHVTGLTLVLDDGSIARTGSLAESRSAPDLTGVFMASEGAFGIVAQAELKITPLPEAYRTILAVFDDLGNSGRAVSNIIAAGILPTAMEIMDHQLIVALEDYLHLGFPLDAEAMLLIELDGLGPELDGQMRAVFDICEKAGAVSLSTAKNSEERDRLWLARRSGNGAMGRIKPATIVQDVTVPISELSGMLSLVQTIAQKHNVTIVQMAHAGDGNLHPHLLYDPYDEAEYDRCLAASHDIFQAALDAGGALTGEHGIGLEKISVMDKQFNDDELAFMARIKSALNPDGRLNPGKVLPENYLPKASGGDQ
ncbi:FAD-binding protein [Deltaproteobacteria bacterium OttesenSCG-928-K17]|nr:FAD-binding protein [Deltaproteobacteria bacterium OttesenSCG-928-K17]